MCIPNIDIPGDNFEIEILRPLSWVREKGCVEGRVILLNIPELGVLTAANVLRIEPCCKIEKGPGQVILGKFTHIHPDFYAP